MSGLSNQQKSSFNKENCRDLSVESFVIATQCNGQLPIKNSVKVTENDDSIRIFQWNGLSEFITFNFMPNSFVDC
jgi:hypothetical protein